MAAQGYNQEEEIEFEETFSSVSRLEVIRSLLDHSFSLNFQLFQIDIKSAFLNGYINENVCVKQPPAFEVFKNLSRVYKLRKAFYRFKRAPRVWYDRLRNFLCERGFEKNIRLILLYSLIKSKIIPY